MLDAVRDAGIELTPVASLDERLDSLRDDAFSLGLRLFLIVGLATLLLAVYGVFASAVLQSRWRSYEVASLRVVGVSQRSLVRASVLEYVAMLGVAVVLGLASAVVAIMLVLPSISLGPTDEFIPPPDYSRAVAVAGPGGGGAVRGRHGDRAGRVAPDDPARQAGDPAVGRAGLTRAVNRTFGCIRPGLAPHCAEAGTKGVAAGCSHAPRPWPDGALGVLRNPGTPP